MATADDVYREHPTDAEVADVLEQRMAGALGTVNADGTVHLTYVLFLHEDGRLYVETSSVTRKARNIERRPTASLLVQGAASTGRNLMVAGEGPARVLHGETAQEINRRLRAKYLVEAAREPIERAWSKLDDVALELRPDRWRSWTGTLLHREATQELGPTMTYEDAWIADP
jgi:nitroimidazol reductase NimA-like FMN-containing flavoprotein (pyridoxamine 5'-phosphate oxidase superfamily)